MDFVLEIEIGGIRAPPSPPPKYLRGRFPLFPLKSPPLLQGWLFIITVTDVVKWNGRPASRLNPGNYLPLQQGGCLPPQTFVTPPNTVPPLEGCWVCYFQWATAVVLSYPTIGPSWVHWIKKAAPSLVFVHCRSHLLQLTLVRASNAIPEMKQVLNAVNTLYSLFSHSPLQLNILRQTEQAVDGMSHKLVQQGATRWLSFEGGSVAL